ncbi:hydroxyacylglutathione hydrolase [Candidatus Erwinia haradaeae]|uniref:Hydroxyacylglutathione hydrolase n=1 Tax=Candidatus Erwinia haradaeae TaxID=1922217 RepID=A0A451DA87_9GAMM|nr:hydroxyacylglutathione hydrolase [Candidatus Erwinia haradaeae]VFP83248.1 Hydroxyacylglutathione hydrolase GloB [Candidatus Erwinia haradaeae]
MDSVKTTLTSILALKDNYIWFISNNKGQCLIVDPSDAELVLDVMIQKNWKLLAVLLTHHHLDHVAGVPLLLQRYPDLVVFGPQETRCYGSNRLVQNGDNINVLDLNFTVFYTPGHTLGHVTYYCHPYLFCGDTLFSAGCGRIFEGTVQQMFTSLRTLNKLPGDTLVCSAHEYTLFNLAFAHHMYPYDTEIIKYYRVVQELRAQNQLTLPTRLDYERKVNIFLRTNNIGLQGVAGRDKIPLTEEQIFALLRAKKDLF